jgi:lysylphosphatidylglycerol synthetase-like protein (DUF2156 family)
MIVTNEVQLTAPGPSQAPGAPIEVLARHAEHASAFLALNAATRHFTVPNRDGLIAFRPCGRWLFQLGSVHAAREDQPRLLEAFRAFARREGKRICAVELRREDAELYRAAGFRVNQLGTSYSLELATFHTKGSRFTQLRNKIHRARREGLAVAELGVDRDRTPAVAERLGALTAEWLESKGRHKKLLDFMVGELGGANEAHRRTFVALRGERVEGFVTYVPAWGKRPGFLHDLSRRRPDAAPGVMELVNATAIERFQEEGVPFLHFGFTPFVGLGEATDRLPGRSAAVSWLLEKLALHGAALYPARSQAAYKLKWAPTVIEPEYVAFEGRFRLGCLHRLLLLTRSI